MLQEVMHIGVTVSDMERSIGFYRDTLGLTFLGELTMQGEETDRLFQRSDCKVRVAYLKGNDHVLSPSIELLQFIGDDAEVMPSDLHRTSISEICFRVADIEQVYAKLTQQGVECLSAPQAFDFSEAGFGKSKAIYFKDPDGIILELMQSVE